MTTTTISVDDTPAPFTTSLTTAGSPYFVKFISGTEAGRVLLITKSTTNMLTLDTTDHTGTAIALTTTGFSVEVGDSFEVFPGDTIASIFGDGSSGNPLVLGGGTLGAKADLVSLYTASNLPTVTYYFNTKMGYWIQTGSSVNASNTIVYPYSAFAVARLAANPTTTIMLSGRITQVSPTTRLVSKASVYTSTHLATAIKLSQLQLSNWTQGATMAAADTLSVWNSALNRFDIFYQMTDSTWRKYPDTTTDQSNFTITAGTVTEIAKRTTVAGATAFLQSSLPYTLQ